MNEFQALECAVRVLDGQSNMARVLTERTGKEVKQQNIWSWLNRSKRLPERFAYAVEEATREAGEVILACDLCPGSFPKPIGKSAA